MVRDRSSMVHQFSAAIRRDEVVDRRWQRRLNQQLRQWLRATEKLSSRPTFKPPRQRCVALRRRCDRSLFLRMVNEYWSGTGTGNRKDCCEFGSQSHGSWWHRSVSLEASSAWTLLRTANSVRLLAGMKQGSPFATWKLLNSGSSFALVHRRGLLFRQTVRFWLSLQKAEPPRSGTRRQANNCEVWRRAIPNAMR